jgi:hypothetical protein
VRSKKLFLSLRKTVLWKYELRQNRGCNRKGVPVDEIDAVYVKNKEAVFDNSPWSSA